MADNACEQPLSATTRRQWRVPSPWVLGAVAAVLLVAFIYLAFVQPVLARRALMRLIEQEGGIVQTWDDSPEWLRDRLPDDWRQGTDSISAVCLFPGPGRDQLTRAIAQGLPSETRLAGIQMDLTASELRALDAPELDSIHLFRNADDESIAALRRFPLLTGVTLHDSPLTDAGLQELAAIPSLKRLELCRCRQITDQGFAEMEANGTLRTVRLEACPQLGDEAVRIAATWPTLQILTLVGSSNLTDDGLTHLRGSPVAILRLYDCAEISGRGFADLAGNRGLWRLDVSGLDYGDDFADELHVMTGLKHITLLDTSVTAAGVERLRAALPHCSVDWRFERHRP